MMRIYLAYEQKELFLAETVREELSKDAFGLKAEFGVLEPFKNDQEPIQILESKISTSSVVITFLPNPKPSEKLLLELSIAAKRNIPILAMRVLGESLRFYQVPQAFKE